MRASAESLREREETVISKALDRREKEILNKYECCPIGEEVMCDLRLKFNLKFIFLLFTFFFKFYLMSRQKRQ